MFNSWKNNINNNAQTILLFTSLTIQKMHYSKNFKTDYIKYYTLHQDYCNLGQAVEELNIEKLEKITREYSTKFNENILINELEKQIGKYFYNPQNNSFFYIDKIEVNSLFEILNNIPINKQNVTSYNKVKKFLEINYSKIKTPSYSTGYYINNKTNDQLIKLANNSKGMNESSKVLAIIKERLEIQKQSEEFIKQ